MHPNEPMSNSLADSSHGAVGAADTRFKILGAISFSHFLNDTIQSLIVSIYPLLKGGFSLSFAQIGVITLAYQMCASMLQPLIGIYTDKHPQAHSLSVGMGCSLVGLLVMAWAPSYGFILLAAALIGTGSAVFHPESSRIARLASGGRHGFAQSIFGVGGAAGSAMGPLLAAWIIIPRGQPSIAWFAIVALLAIVVLWNVGAWYQRQHVNARPTRVRPTTAPPGLSTAAVRRAMGVLVVLVISKYVYLTGITSFYTFYLISKFQLPVKSAQMFLFVFLFAVAAGGLLGGPIGDRIGRKRVIWVSILGVAPFTLVLPYVDLTWTCILSFLVGLVLASAFSAIVVFAQELMPGRVGMVSGIFYGLAFGIGGIGAAALGTVADHYGVDMVYRVCGFFPLLGLVTAALPDIEHRGGAR
jgi:FSR family fosmidomycin resistance protein-like MFS transporter